MADNPRYIVAAASSGFDWFRCGWRLFTAQPWVLVAQLLIFILIGLVLNLVPVIGGLVLALLTPGFVAGWYHSIRQVDQGHAISIGDAWEAFRRQAWIRPMLLFGLVILGAHVLIGLMAFGSLGLEMVADLAAMQAGAMRPVIGAGALLALLVVLLITAVLATALFYGIPLALFQAVAPDRALLSSLGASLRNWRPLLLFGLIYMASAILAAIPIGLGFLILVPVSVCAAYCSYKTVYGSGPDSFPPGSP